MKFPPWQRGKECLPKVDTGILEGICPTATCMLGNVPDQIVTNKILFFFYIIHQNTTETHLVGDLVYQQLLQ